MADIHIQIPALHAVQKRIKTEAKRYNVLECGRRFGKTILGQVLGIDTALLGQPVGWFSPSHKVMAEAWRDMERMLRPITRSKSIAEHRLELITDGVIEFWSLHDNPDVGRSRAFARVIIDEASVARDLEECWQSGIRPALTDKKGDAWFLGTPKGRNYFHRLFAKGEQATENWQSWRFGTADNPYIDRDEVEAARRELPEHIFNQEYLGIPADDGGNPFGLDAIRACISSLSYEQPKVWGWDLAGPPSPQADWTVGHALDTRGNTPAWDRWQKPWHTTIEKIRHITGVTPALVDSSGAGSPITGELQLGTSNIEGFVFSAPSKQQLMDGLAIAINRRDISYQDGVVVRELESFEYEYTRTGVRYSAPAGLHDDCVCALALAVRKLKSTSGDYGVLV